VTVPTLNNDGETYYKGGTLGRIHELTELVGGCTVTNNQGYWVSDSGKLMIDDNQVYTWHYSSLSDQLEQITFLIVRLVSTIINEASQEAIFIEVDGKALLWTDFIENFDDLVHLME